MGWSMGNNNVKGHSLWPTHCMPNLTEPHLEGDEDPSEDNSGQPSDALLLDNLITNNDYKTDQRINYRLLLTAFSTNNLIISN